MIETSSLENVMLTSSNEDKRLNLTKGARTKINEKKKRNVLCFILQWWVRRSAAVIP